MAAISTFAAKTTTANARAVFLKLPLTRSIIEELESFNLCGEFQFLSGARSCRCASGAELTKCPLYGRKDEIGTVHTILERLVPLNDRSKLSRAVAEMSEAVAAARDLGVQRPIFFTPLLAHNNSFYKGGMLFQTAKAGKRKDIIAAGGRYDALVQQFSGPTSSDRRPPHAVGFQLAVGKVALALSRWQTLHVPRLISKPSEEERSFGRWTPRRCDVYVASGPGLFRDRLNIVRGLWAHNISADLM